MIITPGNNFIGGEAKLGGGFVGLLDLYPGAIVAYSLRLLRKAYTGPAIRIRRDSDQNETDIGFSNYVLNQSAITTFCGFDNGYIVKWYDQSGNGNDLFQNTAIVQPKIVDAGGAVITTNGKPAIRYESIEGGYNQLFLTNNVNTNSSISSFEVFSRVSSSTRHPVLCGDFFNSNQYMPWNYSDNVIYFANQDGVVLTAGSVNGQNLFTGINDSIATKKYIYSNGVVIINGVTPLFLSSGNNLLYNFGNRTGAGEPVIGTAQEQILYLSEKLSERSAIETNINNFYGIY